MLIYWLIQWLRLAYLLIHNWVTDKYDKKLNSELLLHPTTELVIAGCCMKSFFTARHNLIEKWFIVV